MVWKCLHWRTLAHTHTHSLLKHLSDSSTKSPPHSSTSPGRARWPVSDPLLCPLPLGYPPPPRVKSCSSLFLSSSSSSVFCSTTTFLSCSRNPRRTMSHRLDQAYLEAGSYPCSDYSGRSVPPPNPSLYRSGLLGFSKPTWPWPRVGTAPGNPGRHKEVRGVCRGSSLTGWTDRRNTVLDWRWWRAEMTIQTKSLSAISQMFAPLTNLKEKIRENNFSFLILRQN